MDGSLGLGNWEEKTREMSGITLQFQGEAPGGWPSLRWGH